MPLLMSPNLCELSTETRRVREERGPGRRLTGPPTRAARVKERTQGHLTWPSGVERHVEPWKGNPIHDTAKDLPLKIY